VPPWWALLALPAAALIASRRRGGVAATTSTRSWTDVDLVQLAVAPLFLVSATSSPPATHLGALQLGPGMLGHVAHPAVRGLRGAVVAARRLERRLLP
jgi:hypothetical protein